MLLPLITVVDTTGSMVHMVTAHLGVFHLLSTRKLRVVPWGGVLNPKALLNENSCELVNSSMHGMPLCLKNSDVTSEEIMGGSPFSNSCTSVSTISFARALLSLSWYALSPATLPLTPVDLSFE
jgi:hypothetical protein